jgi:putative ABC transport system permease protein
MSQVWQDLKYGVRLMRRRPAFSVTVILVLSLGIGVNAGLFSVVNALFFRPLPVQSPDRLFYVYQREPGGRTSGGGFGQPTFDMSVGPTATLADYAAQLQAQNTITLGSVVERVRGEYVSGNYFELLGVGAAIGRPLGTADDDPAATPRAIVVSYDFWTRWLQASPTAVGTTVRLDDGAAVVVGVAPKGFRGLADPFTPSDFWLPLKAVDTRLTGRPIGRLKPGATMADVQNAFKALSPFLARAMADERQERMAGLGGRLAPSFIESILRTEFVALAASAVEMPFDPDSHLIPRPLIAGVIGVVALVLLIATANIAGLLLARGVTRTPEVAVRRALGAGTPRVARQLLTESVLLSAVGGALGLAIAVILVGVFRANAPSRYGIDVVFDVRVIVFAVGVCILAGVITGLAPARQAARVDVLHALGSGVSATKAVRRRLRHAIVIPQIAFSLVLLVVAGVQVRALLAAERADPGYRAGGAMVFNIDLPRPAGLSPEEGRVLTQRQRALYSSLVEQMRGVPGVTAYGVTTLLPLGSRNVGARIVSEIEFLQGQAQPLEIGRVHVSRGYFDAMGIRLLRGRGVNESDTALTGKVVVISAAAAKTLWPYGTGIGQRVAFMQGARPSEWFEVIGVVNDIQPVLPTSRADPAVYVPIEQAESSVFAPTLVARGIGDPTALVRDVSAATLAADPMARVWRARTLEQLVAELRYPRRLAAAVLAATALIGLLFAGIGLYGVVSYSVEQRLREIGIRTTLGAERRDILGLVLREGVLVVTLGSVAGVVVAAIALRWASGVIPSVPRGDISTYLAMTLALGAIVLAACLIPAMRASRVDPAEVLRAQ